VVLRSFLSRVGLTGAFVLAFAVVPLGVLFAYSFGRSTFVSLEFATTLDNYRAAFESDLYPELILRSVWIGLVTGLVSVALAYPFAYAITLGPLRKRGDLFLFIALVSLFSAYIVRVYAWRTLLGRTGAINSGLEALGVIDRPLEFLLYNRFAVVLTLVNVLVPLAVLPLYSSLASVDRDLLEAARNLGASPIRAFWTVTLPLSIRGVQAAFALCFIIAAGDYVTPQLVGGTGAQMLGNTIASKFGVAFDWPLGSALAFLLVAAMGLTFLAFVVVCRLLGLRERPA
jgi:spermidine/putrescine transport system permease protein